MQSDTSVTLTMLVNLMSEIDYQRIRELELLGHSGNQILTPQSRTILQKLNTKVF